MLAECCEQCKDYLQLNSIVHQSLEQSVQLSIEKSLGQRVAVVGHGPERDWMRQYAERVPIVASHPESLGRVRLPAKYGGKSHHFPSCSSWLACSHRIFIAL